VSEGKVTVLKRMVNQDLIDAYQYETVAPCDRFVDGQEFTVEEWEDPPEGFCEWAWADLRPKIALAAKIGTVVACCTDGFRPVIFEIRRE
jgi:uncharacterized repeat protein (TIGR04076 family)